MPPESTPARPLTTPPRAAANATVEGAALAPEIQKLPNRNDDAYYIVEYDDANGRQLMGGYSSPHPSVADNHFRRQFGAHNANAPHDPRTFKSMRAGSERELIDLVEKSRKTSPQPAGDLG